MEIHFKGKSSEYEIERSHFCSEAFVVKDKVKGRDGVEFVTSNVRSLKFSDECFSFDEIFRFLGNLSSENVIVVDDSFGKDLGKRDLNSKKCKFTDDEQESLSEQGKFKFTLVKNPSKIFSKNLFIENLEDFQKNEILELSSGEKVNFLENLEQSGQEFSFAKLEVLNYDDKRDSISFDLELFPSGVSYKYGIHRNTLRIILQGKMKNPEIFAFLRSFSYKNKDKTPGERIFTLTLNQSPVYKLRVNFIT